MNNVEVKYVLSRLNNRFDVLIAAYQTFSDESFCFVRCKDIGGKGLNNYRSVQMYETLTGLTPGGVSNPVCKFNPYPITMECGKGSTIIDVDGNHYFDMCMAHGPLILGHSHPDVVKAVFAQMKKGTVFGAPSVPEMELMNLIRNNVPCADMVRLTNSGTESAIGAIRLARGFTGRDKIVMMNGGFHGSHDPLLAYSEEPGSSAVPSSLGVLEATTNSTYSVDYNDIWQLEDVLKRNDVAAVIMEPIMGNKGVILPEKGYLQNVRKLTRTYGALLIFDEVTTGFRSSEGGAQKIYNVIPDLCTMGKIIGGGFPIGALAGRREIMENLAPSGKVFLAGTFSGNPISASAGRATIELMDGNYRVLSDNTESLVHSLRDSLEDRGVKGAVVYEGSMFQIFFDIDEPRNAAEARKADEKKFEGLFRYMLSNGIYISPSRFEVNFLSVAHDRRALNKFSETFDSYLENIAV
jgi:Glutamate-1-semialdehyde aminotransferase